MPRFPVNFRRKSTAADDQNGSVAEPSFRVLERPSSSHIKTFDGGVRQSRTAGGAPKNNIHDLTMEDNLFAGLNSSRGSGSSNTTKTGSDNSSRHSNVSMTPSSTEYIPQQDEWRNAPSRKPLPSSDNFDAIPPAPPAHKSSGFLKQATRTFSFGGNKKHTLPPIPSEETVPPMPEYKTPQTPNARSRAATASTVTSATPPKLEDSDFKLDLGGEWSSGMLTKFDKRSSVATLKERDANNSRPNQPSPLHLDHSAPIEPPPKSWNSQHSNEGLLGSGRVYSSPVHKDEITPPPPVADVSKPINRYPERRASEEDTEDTTLLSDLSAASKFLASGAADRPYAGRSALPAGSKGSYSKTRYDPNEDEDNIFDKSFGRPPRVATRVGSSSNSTQNNGNKVMTPREFEKYRDNKAKEEKLGLIGSNESDKEDDEINYDDDEDDELERSKQIQKQRQKQEAHLSVYRQQMMKVTGESANPTPRPAMSTSLSTPNLPINHALNTGNTPTPPSDGSEEDEEVPLAILAAHGFPNKNRPPTRLSTMGSQPNLRASMMQQSATAGANSVAGDSNAGGASGGRLPPFARKLPQDPYLGAGLINQAPRESIAFAGGAPAPSRSLPTGGLVGVIANEERARALRRGSPAVDNAKNSMTQLQMNPGFDPINGIPAQMMYPMGMQPPQPPMLTVGEQAQVQMNQQMHQFMQMQMQFMQMMATQNSQTQGQPRPMGHMPTQSVGQMGDMSRNSMMGGDRGSFIGASMTGALGSGLSLDVPHLGPQMRTMSMVQPSSASWIQQPPQPSYVPSINIQAGGYAPSIAPSERSNIGLPGRYRPVSSINIDQSGRTSTMGGAAHHIPSNLKAEPKVATVARDDDEDDDEGWAAMKAKREQKKSLWRSKKTFDSSIGALIN
ncbi:hypothetical protein F5B22DRAFT_418113 [Xylaria bambusicola]|uniref:uncharacterized protein n=1 Tax=Xylaria bambusicola TaxID=326684 RepID=UPI002007908E|nr:uncharacterized protein F5B22DRAFT_418113 [Xylaria bambusicola]KAI0523811.1 hypothetical protein F5B22DRAFT_418113 [Xylaria bambusicola]